MSVRRSEVARNARAVSGIVPRMNQLFGLSYSPWTEKARWALDHHRLPYRYVEHMPMLGELALRRKAGDLTRKATVPLLLTPSGPLRDSLLIAEYADSRGDREPLFPEGRRAEVSAWNDRSERLLAAGRGLVVARMGASERAKQEALPAFLPAALRPALTGLASGGVAFFRWKYGLDASGDDERRAVIAGELRALREALGGRPYLLETFSFADVAMAVTLQVVRPADDEHWPLKDGTREAWRDPALEVDFGDLLEWRNDLYSKHRGRRSR